jgi:hypothetical protein
MIPSVVWMNKLAGVAASHVENFCNHMRDLLESLPSVKPRQVSESNSLEIAL